MQDLRRFTVVATDGEVGSIDDLLFDDRDSRVRYLVVDTAGWLRHHPVLMAPAQIDRVDTPARRLLVTLDRATLEGCPPLDADPPVSRQTERRVRAHFGLQPVTATVPRYEMAFWGALPRGSEHESASAADARSRLADQPATDPHLRSAREIIGYRVQGPDERIGDVHDLVVDTVDGWRVSYLVVDTGRWLPGKRRLVGTDMIEAVSYGAGEIRVDLERDQVAGAPDFDEAEAIDRSAESRLYRHYGFTPRW